MFTASDIMKLRQTTGSGIMDCKNALSQSNGNTEEAIKILREKGLATAEKKSDRVANQGKIAAGTSGEIGAIVEINSETDFSANSPEFNQFTSSILNLIIKNKPKNIDELQNEKTEDGKKVSEALVDFIAKIGENIVIRRFEILTGINVSYIHGNGRLGVLANFTLSDKSKAELQEFKEFSKNICMQIVASKPLYLKKEDVSQNDIEAEKEILKNQALNEGKKEAIIEKMIAGRLQKYYKEVCLYEQVYVKNQEKNVKEYLEGVSKNIGSDIKIEKFVRYERGEGIKMKESNFANEVLKLSKNGE